MCSPIWRSFANTVGISTAPRYLHGGQLQTSIVADAANLPKNYLAIEG